MEKVRITAGPVVGMGTKITIGDHDISHVVHSISFGKMKVGSKTKATIEVFVDSLDVELDAEMLAVIDKRLNPATAGPASDATEEATPVEGSDDGPI